MHTVNGSLEGVSISSLMVTNESRWDMNLINDIFEVRDANLILSIPLQPTTVDSWYWHKEKKGQYYVKSAYYLLQDMKGGYETSNNSGFWKKLWNLKIPSKVQHFIWRATMWCLPTKDQLRVKKVAVNEMCLVCNSEAESVVHSIITCPFYKSCWDRAGIKVPMDTVSSF